jgi:hypothetical protein
MIEPKEVTVKCQNGTERTFILSKFPAIQGREIVAKYPLSAIPKIGDYGVNEETMIKLMAFVGVPRDGVEPLMLTTKALIDNHVPDWECLARIEAGMLEYNCSFFGNGQGATFFEMLATKARQLITQIVMDLSVQSSAQGKPLSKN